MKVVITLAFSILWVSCGAFDATWESIDTRPIPDWYDEAKIGIFIHWGVYSVPAFGSEWFWMHWRGWGDDAYVKFIEQNYPPGFTYQEFAPQFTAKLFNASSWAQLFANSGAKYVVLTSKHHEGYTLWPSSYSYSWNSVDVGPHKDLIGELTAAVREAGLRMGYYYSLLEWYNPLYMADQNSGYTTSIFSENKVQPELRELVEEYLPDIVWSDGEWEASDDYWRSKEFLAWLYTNSSVKDTVVANDRWGSDTLCAHGDFYTCVDRYNPGVLQPFKWENAMTIDKKSWGYRAEANINDYMTTFELIETLVQTVSCGGNILINVGPTKEGKIIPVYQERLLDLGAWLSINGDAIYSSSPWSVQNDTLSNTWYTFKSDAVYAITLEWPTTGIVELGSAAEAFSSTSTVVELLGYGQLSWSLVDGVVSITLPNIIEVTSDWSWVFKITTEANFIKFY